jgi:molybdate transport system substrate-binding protein
MPQRLHILCSMATRQILAELGRDYEQAGRGHVLVESVGGVEAAKRVQGGEAFDVVVLAANALEQLQAAGLIVAGSRVDIARSGMAMAVRAGAPRPRIDDEAAVKDAVLNARRVGYSTGPSGGHLMRMFERWGIAETISQRLVQSPPGTPVGELVARGDAEIGFQQLSELTHVPGIDIIGSLPPDVQVMTTFSAGVCVTSADPAAARALIAYLTSPASHAAIRRQGMEPA